MRKILYFHIYSDYRSGMNICVYDPLHEEDIPDEAFELISFCQKKIIDYI